jgi:polyphosphate kinase
MPDEQQVLINDDARRLMEGQQSTWQDLRVALEAENIFILDRAALTASEPGSPA